MKQISDELEFIAASLGADYMRASSLNDSNIQVHYQDVDRPLVMYVGFGTSKNYYEGAEPLQEVEVDIYVVNKAFTTDETATDIDVMMEDLHQMASDIIYRFKTVRDTLEYSLEPIQMLDDVIVGYLLTVSFILEGNTCTKP